MNQQVRSCVFALSYIVLLLGAVLYVFQGWVAPYLFAVGAAGVTVCYMSVPVVGLDLRHKRLHRFNVISGILMICASGFMFKERSEWILLLTIAAIFQVYTAFVGGNGSSNEK